MPVEEFKTLSSAWKVVIGLLSFMLTTTASVAGYQVTSLIDLQIRIVRIEASRFTTADGSAIKEELLKIRAELNALPRVVPPEWFKEIVVENRKKLEQHEKRLDRLDNRKE